MDISEFSRLDNQGSYLRHPWETSRKNVLHTFLKQSKIKFPVERIVDIGSGDAYVIHTLLEKGLAKEYFAIDIAYNDDVINQLKQNNSHSNVTYLQSLDDYFSNYQTDIKTLYLCMDVLEHLADEDVILKYFLPYKGDDFFFAVPAFQSVFSEHDVLLGHYRRYTLKQLEFVLKKYNFKIVNKGYYFTSLLLFRWIDKVLKKDKKASIDNWNGGKLKTTAINTILSVDFFITSIFRKAGIQFKGLSCYCLCKK